MCQYCEDRYPLDSDFMLFEIVNWKGKQPAILVQYSAPDTYSSVDNLVVPIKFCPMCGRSLTPLALDGGDSPAQLAFSTPEHLPTAGADSTPALRQ